MPVPVAVVRRRSPELLVGLVTATAAAWRIDVPSPWRDEGASWSAAGRPLADLVALTRTVDLVHLPYYLFAHGVLTVHDSITALRWASVVASAATAATLVALGRRLSSASVGVVAGLLFAVAPLTSRYGQEARPYAVAALTATVAALALTRATEPDARRRVWAGYGLTVVATGLVNVLALLVLTGHLVFVLGSRRSTLRSWVLATGGALVVLSPFLVATSRQAGQVSWLTRPGAGELGDVLGAPFDDLTLPGLLLVLALLAAWLRPAWVERSALALGSGWGLLPPVLLWLVSQWHPLFDGRYTVAALPGLCLALASVASRSPSDHTRRVATGATIVAVLAVTGWPAQLRYRDPASGHGEDVRGAVRILARQALPGDTVLFVPYHLRIVTLVAPAIGLPDISKLNDVALGSDAITSATLTGVDVSAVDLPSRMASRPRVWLVSGPTGTAAAVTPTDITKVALLDHDYVEVRRAWVAHFTLSLYEPRGQHR